MLDEDKMLAAAFWDYQPFMRVITILEQCRLKGLTDQLQRCDEN